MTLTIPADFSAEVASAAGSSPHTATLQVQQNEAHNLLATQIGGRVFLELRASLSAVTSQGYLAHIFVGVAQVKQGMTSAGSGAATLSVALRRAATGSSTLTGGIATAAAGSRTPLRRAHQPGQRQSHSRRRRRHRLAGGAGRLAERTQQRRRRRQHGERRQPQPGERRRHAGRRAHQPCERRDAAPQRRGHPGRRERRRCTPA